MQRQYIVKMIGNVQTVALMQVELLYRWLIQQVQLYNPICCHVVGSGRISNSVKLLCMSLLPAI